MLNKFMFVYSEFTKVYDYDIWPWEAGFILEDLTGLRLSLDKGIKIYRSKYVRNCFLANQEFNTVSEIYDFTNVTNDISPDEILKLIPFNRQCFTEADLVQFYIDNHITEVKNTINPEDINWDDYFLCNSDNLVLFV